MALVPFQVDWQAAAGQSLLDVETSLLESTTYQISATHDPMNRIQHMDCRIDWGEYSFDERHGHLVRTSLHCYIEPKSGALD